MKIKSKNQFLTITALLTALAIAIPMVMPLKIVIPPASYTLGSHVAIFLAMFISPLMTVIVILGSTYGFLIAGYPFVIVLRAFSHIVFGTLGAIYLKKAPETLNNSIKKWIFNIVMAIIHALGEVVVCVIFYSSTAYPSGNLFYLLFILVGFGTIIHSIVDFLISDFIFQALKKIR